jgi:phosphoheptose isomerase
MSKMLIDFENIEEKCEEAVSKPEHAKLVDMLADAKRVFLIGNGGLHYVASHMATDLSRLIQEKSVYSFDSVGFITSNANDHGFEHMFTRWLETIALVEDPSECLVIGLSCSGNSANVVNALHWGEEQGFGTFLISGQKSQALNEGMNELSFECDYFHTVEVASMMLFYDLIHRVGSRCPSINQEKVRMADSPLRKVDK